MYASLSRIDAELQHKATGRKAFVQTDHREPGECVDTCEISTLFAMTKVLRAKLMVEEGEPAPLVRYMAAHEPPAFLQAAIAAAGGQLEVESRPVPFQGTPTPTADLADRAFRELACRVLARRGEEPGMEALVRLEQAALSQRPTEDDDEIAYWTCVLELAAVCGELLRNTTGGRWVDDREGMSTIPFAFEAAGGMLFNVAGKTERFLAHGVRDSPHHLVRMSEDGARGGEQPGPVMATLKAADWTARDACVCRPLVESDDPVYADLPWIVYGQDAPNSMAMFGKDGKLENDMAELHRQAVENLRDIQVDLHEMEVEGLRLVFASGSYYACEKLLDVAFMRQMHERLGTPVIAAGVPRKGILVMTNAMVPPDRMGLFMGLLELKFSEEGEGQPLSTCPMLVQDGKVSGVIRKQSDPVSQASRAAARSGPSSGPPPPPVFLPPQGVPRPPGASVTQGPLPPIVLDYSLPPMMWVSRAAAVLAEAKLVRELAVEVRAGGHSVLIPVLCEVGGELWAPYFEPGPWNPQAIARLMQTVAVVRASQYRSLRLQVYGSVPPPPFVMDCLYGGPVPAQVQGTGTQGSSVGVAALIALGVFLVGGIIAVWPPAASPPPVSRPSQVRSSGVVPASPVGQSGALAPGPRASTPGTPPVDDPMRIPAAQQAALDRFLQGKKVPLECLPQEVAPPGVENAWAVSGLDNGAPTGLKSRFTTRETVGVSILERRLRRGQQLQFVLYREGNPRPLVNQSDSVDAEDMVDYLGFYLPSDLTQTPGAYRVTVGLDGRVVKTVPFTIVP